MLEIVVQGRGGQGAQMAGELLATAFFREGKKVQAYATYGGARRGSPVSSFIRVDDSPILLRCDIESPDVIVCFDPSLLNESLLGGTTKETLVLINSSRPPSDFRSEWECRFATIDGGEITAKNNLGRIVNSALVGAFAALVKMPSIEILTEVVRELSPAKVEENVKCCYDGYQAIMERGQTL